MKKLLLTLAFAGGIACSSFAQTPTSASTSEASIGGGFSIGADVGLPTGTASEVYSAVVGASIKYDARMAPNVYFTLSAGYQAFLAKSEFKVPGGPSSDNFIPLKGGIKLYVNNGLFIEGQAGVAIYTGDDGFTAFAYAPGMGYSFAGGFEVGARYEGWSKEGTLGQACLRLAFKFK